MELAGNSHQEVLRNFMMVVSVRFRLAKGGLCLLIGGSTLFGYILAFPAFSFQMVAVACSVFLLATGAATLNSLQECRLDGDMERTRNRPLPLGLLTPKQAAIQAALLLLAGCAVLYLASEALLPLLVGIAAVGLYNAIYTPLKTKTVLAIIPGAVCGALPPYIGYLAGGGAPVSFSAALMLTLFILWQVPHFWLVLLSCSDDYIGMSSRLPNLLGQFKENRLKRFFVTWIGALGLVMLLFIVLPLALSEFFRLAIVLNGCLMFLVFIYGLAIREEPNYRLLFTLLNIFLVTHMVFVATGRIMA